MIEDYLIIQGVLGFAGLLIVLLVFSILVDKVFTKSREYRKLLADMFVAGKIKQIAAKEGLDLIKELSDYAKFMKAKHIDYEALDNTVERELQEKISDISPEKEKK
jgi:hypothetical protein